MKKRLRAASAVAATLVAALWPYSASIAADDLSAKEGLVAFVLREDPALARVVDTCRNLSVVRSGHKLAQFEIKAECTIKDNREEDMDCPAYRIDASGTIDTPSHATVRKLTMSLLCTG